MRKLLLLFILLCCAEVSYSQITVDVRVVNAKPDTLKGRRVYIYPDTSVTSPLFAIQTDTTSSFAVATFKIPTLPLNTDFYVSTLQCDSQTFKIDTLTYTGINSMAAFIKICISSTDSFSGNVLLGDQTKRPKVKQARVYLIQKCSGNKLTFIDSIETGIDGYFKADSFPVLPAGCELILWARLLPVSSQYKRYLPAYRAGADYSLQWFGAKKITRFVDQKEINITLPEAINPTGGPSEILGHAMNKNGSMMVGTILMITDMLDVPVAYVYVDTNGNFSFPSLPFGTYKIFGDIWGLDNPPLIVTVSADHVKEPRVVFTEASTEFKGHIAVSVVNIDDALQQLQVYPNPVGKSINIKGINKLAGNKTAVLYAMSGAIVLQKEFTENEQVTMDVPDLSEGVYILKVTTLKGNAVFRVTKSAE